MVGLGVNIMYGKRRRIESPSDNRISPPVNDGIVDGPNYHHINESPSKTFDQIIQESFIPQSSQPVSPLKRSNRNRIVAPSSGSSIFDSMMRKAAQKQPDSPISATKQPVKQSTKLSKSTSNSSSIKTSPKSSKKRRRITSSSIPDSSQTCLDLGQKPLAMEECPTCSFQYQRGHVDDEKMHKERHDQHVNGFTFDGWKQEPIIDQPSSNERILCLKQSDLKHREHSVRAWIDRLHRELGHCRSPISSQSSDSSSQSSPQSLLDDDEQLLVYIKQRRVIGLMIVKLDINDARRIDEQGKSLQAITETDPSVHAPLGVDRIWVLAAQRRKGVATRLLNAAVSHCLNMSIDPSSIAFSQPTQQGRYLAQHYTKQNQFLAYC